MEDIKKLNEKLEQYLEDQIEWRYEKICDIEPLLTNEDSFNENLFNEIFISDVDMYGQLDLKEAVDNIAKYYHEGKLRVAIPTTTKFNFNNNQYHLHLVLGNCVIEQRKIKCKYGVKHILDKHSKENVEQVDKQSLTTEQALLNAMKDIEKALNNGQAFMGKYHKDRLAVLYNGFLYVICYSENPKELTYLHTLFKPDKNYKRTTLKNQYIKVSNPKIAKKDP